MDFNNSVIFDSDLEWVDLQNGIRRKVMTHSDTLMLVKFEFQAGAVGVLHRHPHLQMSYVAEGSFEFTIEGTSKTMHKGDVYSVPPNAEHGVVCLEAGLLVDVFSPMRADFL